MFGCYKNSVLQNIWNILCTSKENKNTNTLIIKKHTSYMHIHTICKDKIILGTFKYFCQTFRIYKHFYIIIKFYCKKSQQKYRISNFLNQN